MRFARHLLFCLRWTPPIVNVATLCGVASAAATLPADHAQRMTRGLTTFQKDIAPLLKTNCLKCHGIDATKGDLDMATREDLLRGSHNGPVVVPFDAAKSVLVEVINHTKEPNMPKDKPKLSSESIAKLTSWINDGAPYAEPLIAGRKPKRDPTKVTDEDRQWWSFLPLKDAAAKPLTPVEGAKKIDEMLLAKAKSKGLTFNPKADSATLVRRMYLDLTGIPPTPEELSAVADGTHTSHESHSSCEALANNLLSSPRFGERWARHWLDVARFAESTGFEQDYDRPFAFHYRDFVIKALNSDMPFDQFVKWQLAGDEWEPTNPLALAATGFLGAGVFPSQITANEVERTRYDAMDDMLSTTGAGLLGLSVGCARCHDNKYDPIPSRDYYQMLSTFTTTTRMNVDVWPDKVTSAITTKKEKDKDTPPQKGATRMMICGEGYEPIVMHTQGGPFFDQTYFLKRGNTDLKDGEAKQGFLQIFARTGDEKRWQWSPPEGAKYSGRRRTLSNWITDVNHGAGALLARVIVNRLWQHHFGTGIVSTPNDFGKTGNAPSQPELLDWLASQLIANGWKMKPIHQMILLSQAWQQSTQRDAAKEATDPGNELFMYRKPQRLEGEAIRDSMLAVSGLLDATMFGPGMRDENSKRRSIYFNIKRSQLIGSMVAFDAPEPLVSQGARPTTTVAPQALILMNSPQARGWAESLAKRVRDVSDVGQRIKDAYLICFNRAPRADEIASGQAFIESQRTSYAAEKKPNAEALAMADYCQVLLGLNEFVYVN
ncbi:MAG: PSD1 and planctomycete cytochrome C domain-containing protein [Verrucomicrobiaceae bacterium]|nr:PSD1 and planctomycete cytochrome C domain-containing protein [Verrucomicrobiaceae bacterium]